MLNMAASIDLNIARTNLSEALGDNMKVYLHNLKSWFRQKVNYLGLGEWIHQHMEISKEEFDSDARKLLKADSVHLHNEFLLAIISKCQSLGSSLVPRDLPSVTSPTVPSKPLKKGKFKKKLQGLKGSFQHRFVPVNPTSGADPVVYKGVEESSTVFCSRELVLPNASMVHGRMIVCAWEAGLKDVEEKAVKLVMQAIEHQLKKIISQVLSRRNGYKLREKRFQYAMGCKVPSPYLRHSILIQDSALESEATTITDNGNHIPSIKLPYDFAESHAAQQISMASTCAINRGPVTLYDLLEALQLYRNAIPSHTVYATAMERIIHKLWHTSNEELEQEVTHRQEVLVKQQLATQHASIR